MTTLIDIPSCTALHIPTPGASPLPLSTGDLTLIVIPANPPTHPSATLTLTVGDSSFPLLPNSPVQKVQSKKEHASYSFRPVPADGGAGIGEVRVVMKDSTNQGEWEATEALCAKFEAALKSHECWDDKTLFVDDEYETGGPTPGRGWGEAIAGAVVGAGQTLAERLNAFTDRHVATTNPTHPAPPSELTSERAGYVSQSTASIAASAESGAQKIGHYIHEGGKKVGAMLPDSVAKAADPVPEHEKSDLRKTAESGWEQVTIAAKGLASAATTVAGAVSGNAHRAVEHNFGKEADKVAVDVGASGANLGSTAMSAGVATSAIIQGSNAASGVAASRQGQQ